LAVSAIARSYARGVGRAAEQFGVRRVQRL
jgi:hypothetical protein